MLSKRQQAQVAGAPVHAPLDQALLRRRHRDAGADRRGAAGADGQPAHDARHVAPLLGARPPGCAAAEDCPPGAPPSPQAMCDLPWVEDITRCARQVARHVSRPERSRSSFDGAKRISSTPARSGTSPGRSSSATCAPVQGVSALICNSSIAARVAFLLLIGVRYMSSWLSFALHGPHAMERGLIRISRAFGMHCLRFRAWVVIVMRQRGLQHFEPPCSCPTEPLYGRALRSVSCHFPHTETTRRG